jgi:hypothetical protein
MVVTHTLQNNIGTALGNDAAHINAKDYDPIGSNESKLAIELAKELLKAVYQYASLVDRLSIEKLRISHGRY